MLALERNQSSTGPVTDERARFPGIGDRSKRDGARCDRRRPTVGLYRFVKMSRQAPPTRIAVPVKRDPGLGPSKAEAGVHCAGWTPI